MVRVEQALCADCGGCVGACHVNCITIVDAPPEAFAVGAGSLKGEGSGASEPQRARGAPHRLLTIGAACDECNVCVLLCPTGALGAEVPLKDWRRR